ncbi:hypothetical protein BCR42DRAFT_469334 [Absidia repens]|uniref:Uncharacterized protein n=1 Tax=Absidia repens TaxID=90262 RepID=A0A1X2I8G8_9FUNG|nr:hypothetical protein BCR42DRAFT_469334 [Absidia repens]
MTSFCGVLALAFMMTVPWVFHVSAQEKTDKSMYMIHYNGLDTFPATYGECTALKREGKHRGVVVIAEHPSHCTAYNDIQCEEQASYPAGMVPGLTDLTELGKEFSKDAFMICTLDT